MLAGQSLELQVRDTDPPAQLTAAAGRELAELIDAETDPERLQPPGCGAARRLLRPPVCALP